MKSTIIFYTHNFLSRKLLESTIHEAINHAKINDCFLLIISHFPILKDFEDVSGLFDGDIAANLPNDLSKFCITDLQIDVNKNRAINYVTGKLPYNYMSILKQLFFAFKQAKTENCILYEHDCFYPINYYSVVEKNLEKHEMTYAKNNYWMVNTDGFYKCDPHIYLSSFSAKTKTFIKIFDNKLKIYAKNGSIKVFEPLVPCVYVVKDINWLKNEKQMKKMIRIKNKNDDNEPIMKNQSNFKEEIVAESFCIDEELENSILEVQHGLNTSASLYIMRTIYDNGDLEEEYKEKLLIHPYWGDSKKYIDMIEVVEENELTNRMNRVGVHHCGL